MAIEIINSLFCKIRIISIINISLFIEIAIKTAISIFTRGIYCQVRKKLGIYAEKIHLLCHKEDVIYNDKR